MVRIEASGTVSIIVADASRNPPVIRPPATDLEHWRGLHIVEALSARWGWALRGNGKAVYSILTRKA